MNYFLFLFLISSITEISVRLLTLEWATIFSQLIDNFYVNYM